MIRVGLTGVFGAGKTTVLGFFRKLGARTWDADAAAHRELAHNKDLQKKISRLFGLPGFRGRCRDRRRLAACVFSDRKKLEQLNALVHPLVKKRLLAYFRKNRTSSVMIAEIPLLFETDFYKFFHWTVCVAARTKVRRERVILKKRCAPQDIARRARWQLPLSVKIARCDRVIDNNGTRKETFKQVQTIMEEAKWKSSKSQS